MKSGKVSETVLKRSVLKYITAKRNDVISGSGIARDGCVIKIPKNENAVFAGNPTVLDREESVLLSFHSALNNLAAAGGKPIGININLILPVLTEEIEIKKIIGTYDKLCSIYNIQIIGGHTELSEVVNKPIAIVMAAGSICSNNILDIKNIKPGNDIVMTKYAGLEGTYRLYIENQEYLKNRFSGSFLLKFENIKDELSVLKEAAISMEHGAVAMHDVREGGIFKGLWEIGSGSGLGVEVEFKEIQVKQETIELTEVLDRNPYKILAGGTLLVITEDGDGLVDKLKNNSINATIIGKVTNTRERVLVTDEGKRYLESN